MSQGSLLALSLPVRGKSQKTGKEGLRVPSNTPVFDKTPQLKLASSRRKSLVKGLDRGVERSWLLGHFRAYYVR
jgi:hypothetical protein